MATKKQPGISIELSEGWKDFHLWSAAFQGKLEQASRAGLKKAMQFILAETDKRIRQGRYRKLAPLTLFMRQLEGYGETPLLRRGALVRSLSTDLVNSFEGNVGLLKQGRNGKDYSNIGVLLHDGGRIRITEAMRRAFARRLGRLAAKRGVSVLGTSRGSKKNILRIPPRPFMKEVFDDPLVAIKVEQIFFDEVRNFMRL